VLAKKLLFTPPLCLVVLGLLFCFSGSPPCTLPHTHNDSSTPPLLFPLTLQKECTSSSKACVRSYCRNIHPWLGFSRSVKVAVTPTRNGSGCTVVHTRTLSAPQLTLHVIAFLLPLPLIGPLGFNSNRAQPNPGRLTSPAHHEQLILILKVKNKDKTTEVVRRHMGLERQPLRTTSASCWRELSILPAPDFTVLQLCCRSSWLILEQH